MREIKILSEGTEYGLQYSINYYIKLGWKLHHCFIGNVNNKYNYHAVMYRG